MSGSCLLGYRHKINVGSRWTGELVTAGVTRILAGTFPPWVGSEREHALFRAECVARPVDSTTRGTISLVKNCPRGVCVGGGPRIRVGELPCEDGSLRSQGCSLVCPLPRLGPRANQSGASWHTGARGGAVCDSSQIPRNWQYVQAKLYPFFTNPTLGLVFTANRGHSRNASFALRHSAIGIRHLGSGRHRPVAKADAAWTGRSVPGTGGL